MNQHKLKYILVIAFIIIGCSSERDKIERKIYSFSTNFPTALLLRTLERVDVKFEVSWNICKPQIFWSIYQEFNESTIKNEVYKSVWHRARYESTLYKNNDFLIQDPSVVDRIKDKAQNKITELGICIKKLKIAKI